MELKEYSLKKVLTNSSIYSFTALLQKSLSFFLLPLYTAFLKPGDYGLIALILTFMSFVALLATLALNGAISRFYFVYKSDDDKVRSFFGTIIIGILFNCLFWFIIVLVFSEKISNIFLNNIDFYPFIFIALLSTVTSPIYSIYQSILQIKQEAKQYSINSLSFFTLAISLNIIFIVFLKLGATGLLLANAIPNVLFSISAILILVKRKHIILVFRFHFMSEAIRYSIPLIPHLLSGSITDYISKSFLSVKTNLTNLGLYNIAFQFGSVLDIIQSSIMNAFYPMVYDTLDNQRENLSQIIKITTFIFKGTCLICVAITLFSKEVVILMTFGNSYYNAWKVIPIIAFGALFQSLYTFYGTLLFYNRKSTKYLWIASTSGNLAHVVFSVWYTTLFLYLTPALAGVIQRALLFVVVYFISRKYEPVDYELLKMLSIILLFIVSSVVGLAFDIILPYQYISINRIFWKIFVLLLTSTILFYEEKYLLLKLFNSLCGRNSYEKYFKKNKIS